MTRLLALLAACVVPLLPITAMAGELAPVVICVGPDGAVSLQLGDVSHYHEHVSPSAHEHCHCHCHGDHHAHGVPHAHSCPPDDDMRPIAPCHHLILPAADTRLGAAPAADGLAAPAVVATVALVDRTAQSATPTRPPLAGPAPPPLSLVLTQSVQLRN